MEFPPEIIQSAEEAKERLDIHIHYSPHGSLEDLQTAERLIRSGQYDIYVPEIPHGNEQSDALWLRIAQGDSKLYAQISEIFRRKKAVSELASISIFYASGIPIILPDITKKEGQQFGVDDLVQRQLPFEFDGFENDYQRTRVEVHRHAKNIYFRDHILATRAPAYAMDLINSDTELSEQEKVKVLITLGSRHTLLSHLLRQNGYQVSRSFNVMPHIFTPLDSAARKIIFNGELPENDYMAAHKQFILYLPLAQYLHHNPHNTAASFALARRAVDMVSDDQAREFYELLKEGDPRYKELADVLMAQATADNTRVPYPH